MQKHYKRVYITTALPYVNSVPHVGFAWEILIADAMARYFRNQGKEVLFLTGSDENSFRIALAAEIKGISVRELIDTNSGRFIDLKRALNLSFDIFFRTSSKVHHKGARKIWRKFNNDDVYRANWSAWYCLGCESFYKKDKLIDGKLCPEHLKELEFVNEDVYFFKFNKHKDELIKLFNNNSINIIPPVKKKEIIDEIKEFHDFNISRHKVNNWGVDVPEKGYNEVIYAFLEALVGYINGIGYQDKLGKFEKWWQDPNTRIIHVFGRGITRFHTVYWPVVLSSADLRLPTDVFVHGYLTADGQKISKSLGNTIDPLDLVKGYSIDQVRFYFFSNFSPFKDGDFSMLDLKKVSETEFKRIDLLIKLAINKLRSKKIDLIVGKRVKNRIEKLEKEYVKHMELFHFQQALDVSVRSLELVKNMEDFNTIRLALAKFSIFIEPFMPNLSSNISRKIN